MVMGVVVRPDGPGLSTPLHLFLPLKVMCHSHVSWGPMGGFTITVLIYHNNSWLKCARYDLGEERHHDDHNTSDDDDADHMRQHHL